MGLVQTFDHDITEEDDAFILVAGFVAQTMRVFQGHNPVECFECRNGGKTVDECFRDQAMTALISGGAADYWSIAEAIRENDDKFYPLISKVGDQMTEDWVKVVALAELLLTESRLTGVQIKEAME
jgi:hypothetical protein